MMQGGSSPSIGAWVLVLGGVGFATGFFGPIALNPDANQGPLLGLFITGPGGALLGLALSVLIRLVPVGAAVQYRVLAVTAVALAIGTLYYCLPEPELQGVLVEGTVRHCQAPEELTGAAVQEWQRRIAKAPWGEPRTGWQHDVDRMLAEYDGVVLTLDVQREDRVLRHRKPWNSGRLSTEGGQSTLSTRFYFADFAGGACADYERALLTLFVPHGQGSRVWPPDDLANFLGVARIEVASPQYLGLSGN